MKLVLKPIVIIALLLPTMSINAAELVKNNTYIGAPAFDPALDNDGDGMLNGWEYHYRLNMNDASDASTDLDSDSFTNLEEYLAATSPDDLTSYPAISQPNSKIKGLEVVGYGLKSSSSSCMVSKTMKNENGDDYMYSDSAGNCSCAEPSALAVIGLVSRVRSYQCVIE